MPTKPVTHRNYFPIIVLLLVLSSAFSWRPDGGVNVPVAQGGGEDFLDVNPAYEWGAYISIDSRFNYDSATGMAVDNLGNLIVLSVSADSSISDGTRPAEDPTQIYISKVAPGGNLEWQIALDTSEESVSYAGSIALDNDGNIYVTGYSEDTTSPFYTEYGDPIFLAKFDPNGSLLWNTLVEIPDPYLSSMSVDLNGNVYIVGSGIIQEYDLNTETPEIQNFSLAKVSTQGNLEWILSFGEFIMAEQFGGVNNRFEVDTDQNGFIYVAGEVNSTWGEPINEFSGARDVFVAKFDDMGSLLWNTFLGLNGSDRYEDLGNGNSRIADAFISDIQIDNNGDVCIVGESEKSWGNPIIPFYGNEDTFLAKMDGNGNLLWNTFFGGQSGDDNVMGITINQENNIFVVGNNDTGWGNPIKPYEEIKFAYVAQFNPTGTILWNTFIQGSGVQFEMADDESFYFLSSFDYLFYGEPVTILGTDHDGDSNNNDLFVAKLSLYSNSAYREPGIFVPDLTTHVPTPREVSTDPRDILGNLSLAAFLMLPFAIAVDVFSRMVSDNEKSLNRFAPIAWIGYIQNKIASSTIAKLSNHRIKDLLRLLIVAAFYGLVFSLLDPTWNPISVPGILLFVYMVIAFGLVGLLDDILQWRTIRKWDVKGEFAVRPTNVFLALVSTAVSRLLSLVPGFMFGSPEAIKIDEASLSDQQKRHLVRISIFTYIGVGLISWLPTAFMDSAPNTLLGGIQATLLVIYAAALENTFIQLLGLSDGLGTRLRSWNKWVWVTTLGAVAFWFLHTLLNPTGNFMKDLQKGNIPLFVEVAISFIVITFLLNFFQRYRKSKKQKINSA